MTHYQASRISSEQDHAENIDVAVSALLGLLRVGAELYAPLNLALPVITLLVRDSASKLKKGIADGTIVPDGRGGFVPASNSRYDQKTGEFL